MCERRSAAPVRALIRLASFRSTPEITLKYETRPANGSATVLKTNAETGPESFTARSASAPLSVPFQAPRSAGLGKFSTHEVQNQVAADVVQSGGAQHRENAHAADRLAQAVQNMLHRQRALVEELFQQRVVAFSDHLDQRFMRRSARRRPDWRESSPSLPLPSPSGV